MFKTVSVLSMGEDSGVGIPSVCGPVSATVNPADPSGGLYLRGLPEGTITIYCFFMGERGRGGRGKLP